MKITGYMTIIIFSLFLLSVSIHAEVRGQSYTADATQFSNHFTGGPFKNSEKGIFKVAVISSAGGFKAGQNTADIIVHDRNGRGIADAKITITPWMPDMGHGSPEQPVITEKGGGLYSAENIVFNMGGYWELRMKIRKDGVQDSVVFIFPEVSGE